MELVNLKNLIFIFLILVICCFAAIYFVKYLFHWKKYSKIEKTLKKISQFKEQSFAYRGFMHLLLLSLFILTFLFTIIRPTNGFDTISGVSGDYDIAFAVDTSLSMAVEDFTQDSGSNINRLEGAKSELTKLINEIPNNRFCLISYKHNAFTELPLTHDKQTLISGIKTLTLPLSYKAQGSSIAVGLKEALNRLTSSPDFETRNKVIILVSDGEEIGKANKALDDILNELKSKSIRVFTLGVGTKEGGKIPINDFENSKSTEKLYVRFNKEDVISKLSEESLINISNKTDGKYYALNSNFDTKQILAEIKQSTSDIKSGETKIYKDLYFYFAGGSLILFIIFDLGLYHWSIFGKKKNL